MNEYILNQLGEPEYEGQKKNLIYIRPLQNEDLLLDELPKEYENGIMRFEVFRGKWISID